MELVDTNTDMHSASKLEWQCLCGYRETPNPNHQLSAKDYREKFGED